MSAIVRPFAFGAEFLDADDGPASIAALELEVAELRLQLADAHERGIAQGRAEALALLQGERDTALLAATEALTLTLASFDRRFAAVEREVARHGAELALDFADQLAVQALSRAPAAPVEKLIGEALAQLRRDCPLRIRVAPALVTAVEAMIEQRREREREQLRIIVIVDDALEDGDARIDWDTGALLLDRAARKAALAAEIAGVLAA